MGQTQYVHANCPRCGNKLTYDGGAKKALKCGNCKYSRALGRTTDQVDNHPLTAGIQWNTFARGFELKLVEKSCPGCKAHIGFGPQTDATVCPFCRTELSETEGKANRKFTPFGIIPFTISQQQGVETLAKFLRNPFVPPALKQQVLAPDGLQGIYVPMWYLDALTRSTWKADILLRYMQPQKGKPQQKEVWDKASGYYEHFFENETRFLSKGLNGGLFRKLLPYNLSKVADYDADYLNKWPVEIYPQREGDEIKAAEKGIHSKIESEAKKRAKGERVKEFKLKSEKHLIAMRHVLVPVWVAPYTYRGKRYQYLVNGQNGKLVGDRPLSTSRIVMAVGGVLALLSLLTILF